MLLQYVDFAMQKIYLGMRTCLTVGKLKDHKLCKSL